MPTNWPPTGAPAWPPVELNTTWLSTCDLRFLVQILLEAGFTHAAPTTVEQNAFFKKAQCDEGHSVIGRMVISPGGVRYPVAVCQHPQHRDVLVLWPPYYCGFDSANYEW